MAPIGQDESARWIPADAAVRLALTTTSARTAALPVGAYWIASDVDAFVLAGGASVTAIVPTDAASSVPLFAKVARQIQITPVANYVAAIVVAGTGNVYVWRHA